MILSFFKYCSESASEKVFIDLLGWFYAKWNKTVQVTNFKVDMQGRVKHWIDLICFDHDLNELSGKHVLNKLYHVELCKWSGLTCDVWTRQEHAKLQILTDRKNQIILMWLASLHQWIQQQDVNIKNKKLQKWEARYLKKTKQKAESSGARLMERMVKAKH